MPPSNTVRMAKPVSHTSSHPFSNKGMIISIDIMMMIMMIIISSSEGIWIRRLP